MPDEQMSDKLAPVTSALIAYTGSAIKAWMYAKSALLRTRFEPNHANPNEARLAADSQQAIDDIEGAFEFSDSEARTMGRFAESLCKRRGWPVSAAL